MVSLPDIFQRGSQNENTSSSGNSESNISTYFCYDCTYDLALPVRKINQNTLRTYEEKCAQIRYMQRLLYQEDSPEVDRELLKSFNVERTSKFQISNNTKETLQIYAFGFPLIRQSRLLRPRSEEFNLERIKNKILKRQTRFNILNKTPQVRNEKRALRSKYAKNKVNKLPTIETHITKIKTNKNKKNCVDREGPPHRKTLSADPEEIVFDNFEVGGYYEKKCKIKNVSSGKCIFQILPMDNTSQFKVAYNKATTTLAAGLSLYVTIQFVCNSLADTEDELVIKSKNGEDLVVPIKAESDSPYLIEVNDKACNLDEVVDSFVDCGSHFVGEKGHVTLTLKNIGSAGIFCFITESDWVNFEFTMDPSNALLADPFRIQPMYFSLKRDQEITIRITAVPPSCGMHTTRLLLLCKNGTLNAIDIVCDGVLFEPSLIEHLDMLKTFDIDIPDVTFSECYIDFGQVLTFDSRYFCFFLLNMSGVNMGYHWELRKVSVPGTEALPEVALSIVPMRSSSLAPGIAELFCLRMCTDEVPPGVYRSLLVLVIDGLPKKCIPLEYCEKLLPADEEDDSGLRSIETKYIEVWLECVSPCISLTPYIIDFTDFPLVQGSTIKNREIIVKNESPGALLLKWNCFKECQQVRVSIDPSQLQCEMHSTCVFTLSVEAVLEGHFELSFWCISEKGNAKVELLVRGYCCKPQLTTLTNSIDLGLVKIGTQKTTAIVSKNRSSSDNFQWNLDELLFTSSDEGLTPMTDASTSLSANGGEFCHKNSEILVTYQLDCQEDSLWCSVLDWDGNFIPVIANTQTPDVSLSNYTISVDSLYLNLLSRVRVTVINHSLFSVPFFWGCPTDKGLGTAVTVEVVPRCFVLEPKGQVVVEIMVTPHETGPLENLYVPCFVEGNTQPLLVKIEGIVGSLKVRVEWDSKDQHCCVFWPPEEPEFKESCELLRKAVCKCPPNSLQISEISVNEKCNIVSLHSDVALNISYEDTEVNNIPNDCAEGVEIEMSNDEEDNISIASSIPYLNWPIVGGRYTRDPMDDEWESQFNNLFILDEISGETKYNKESIDSSPEQNVLCFQDIPVRKAITQTIYIRNDTPIPSTYEASVVYNFERVHKTDKLLDAEIRLRKIKEDNEEYVVRASPNRGLTVFVTPENGELGPDDYAMLSVTVVALSWGQYSDMIVLQVGDLKHLCVRLSVSVPQPPVISPKLIGFGSLTHRCPPVSRYFKVENVSTVPVYVCWDIFTPSDNTFPFSVMLFDGNPFDLQLTDYYGSNSSQVFQIKEKYTFLESHSSTMIKVDCYPNLVHLDILNNKDTFKILRAALIGNIYITEEGKLLSNNDNCIRFDGSKLLPLRIDLEVRMDVPLLSLLNVYNYHLTFKCSTYDIMKTKEKVWNSSSVIRVQNNSSTIIEAKVYTVGYFHVSKIEYPCNEEENNDSKHSIVLRPDESCEVTIVCEMTKSDLLDCFDPDEEGIEEEAIGACSVEKGLLCFEQKEVRQDVQLELWLYPPLLHFSEISLNFGTVYIGDTKRLVIQIAAPITEEYFEVFIKGGKNSAFDTDTSSEVLKPKTCHLVEVKFTPKYCTFYQDVLVVRTCIEKMVREIPLTGIGTFDYRAHSY